MNLSFPENYLKPIKCLNNFDLKLIAIITMLIDHIGAILFPYCMILRIIGRVAFPIFVFLLVEGFQKTSNVRKYEIRLVIFAIVSEIPFDLAFHSNIFVKDYQNVFFTLALGLILLDILNRMKQQYILQIVLLFFFMYIAYFLSTDYSAGGILLIFVFYYFRNIPLVKIAVLLLVSHFMYGNPIEQYSLLAFIPLLLYNGEKGPDGKKETEKGKIKTPLSIFLQYFFYFFYPAHLLILHLIDKIR